MGIILTSKLMGPRNFMLFLNSYIGLVLKFGDFRFNFDAKIQVINSVFYFGTACLVAL